MLLQRKMNNTPPAVNTNERKGAIKMNNQNYNQNPGQNNRSQNSQNNPQNRSQNNSQNNGPSSSRNSKQEIPDYGSKSQNKKIEMRRDQESRY